MANLVLLVEDDPDQRELFRVYLSAHGFEVATASDVDGALAVLRDRAPDVVVTDMRLPRMDGSALIACLRFDAKTRRIPIVGMSAVDLQLSAAIEIGCDHVLEKPCPLSTLLASIHSVLDAAT